MLNVWPDITLPISKSEDEEEDSDWDPESMPARRLEPGKMLSLGPGARSHDALQHV